MRKFGMALSVGFAVALSLSFSAREVGASEANEVSPVVSSDVQVPDMPDPTPSNLMAGRAVIQEFIHSPNARHAVRFRRKLSASEAARFRKFKEYIQAGAIKAPVDASLDAGTFDGKSFAEDIVFRFVSPERDGRGFTLTTKPDRRGKWRIVDFGITVQ